MLGLAKVEALSGKTLISVTDMQILFGLLWLGVVVLFLLAVGGLATNQHWWKVVAYVAVVVSQFLITIWWPDAKWGTIANVFVLITVFYSNL